MAEIRTLVVDDEPPARRGIRQLLSPHPDFVVVGEARDGRDALRALDQLAPDLIFLDVQMPVLDGLGVLRARGADRMPATVFVTAHDEFAVRAFEAHAVDYLVKPVEWDQLSNVLEKYGCRPGAEPGVVLVIDDDPAVREYMRRVLEDDGWTVVEAEHGQAGLERLGEVRPSLILLDLMMPVMDGFEFVEEVRRDADLASIPILVLTAKDPTARDRQRLNGGVKRILHKGAHEREEVLEQIHALIARSVRAGVET